jgi:hypothetical protein
VGKSKASTAPSTPSHCEKEEEPQLQWVRRSGSRYQEESWIVIGKSGVISVTDKPFVWQMVKEAVEHCGGQASNGRFRSYNQNNSDAVNIQSTALLCHAA